jgi:hypothetical protein
MGKAHRERVVAAGRDGRGEALIDSDNRARFERMGLERVRVALVRGFDIPRGPMREDALDWVKEQEVGRNAVPASSWWQR